MTQEPSPPEKPSGDPKDPTKEKERQVRWIDTLAQRSAGLPSDPKGAKDPGEKSPWSYAGAGLQFAVTAALFALMGLYVDRRFNWSPWGTVSLSTLGFVGGIYLLIKEALRDQDKGG